MTSFESFELVPARQEFADPTFIHLLSFRGALNPYHLENSFYPFSARYRNLLSQAYPGGLFVTEYRDDADTSKGRHLFICFQPHALSRDRIEVAVRKFPHSSRHLIHYENPIGYSFRNWVFSEDFTSSFATIFSSAALYCDNQRFFWVPGWNFYIDFSTGEPRYPPSNSVDSSSRKILVVNPIRTGFNVSPERIALINSCLQTIEDSEYFGERELLAQQGLSHWLPHWQGDLPYSGSIYRFENKPLIFARYKFVLVIENCFQYGYVTEKLGEPLISGSIPIYFGDYNIEFFIPDLFSHGAINGHSYTSPEELFSSIKAMTSEEIRKRLEKIEQHRQVYFDLTSRRNIFDFTLRKILGLNAQAERNPIDKINLKISERNRSLAYQDAQSRVLKLIKDFPGRSEYDPLVREVFRELGSDIGSR